MECLKHHRVSLAGTELSWRLRNQRRPNRILDRTLLGRMVVGIHAMADPVRGVSSRTLGGRDLGGRGGRKSDFGVWGKTWDDLAGWLQTLLSAAM